MKYRTDRDGVLLSGYYGHGNLGDDLLLAVATEELRAILPQAGFLVRNHGAIALLPKLGPNIELTGVDEVLADQSRPRFVRFAIYVWHISNLLRRCRWLVFGGGTVFHDHGGLASLALQWTTCNLARVFGVRIAALGVGVGNLQTSIGRCLLRRIVARADLFLVRDAASLRQCADTSARLTADLVFAWKALTPGHLGLPSRAQQQLCVGLTVAAPLDGRTTAALADAIRCWQEHGHRVIFLVFKQSSNMTDDAAMFTNIREKIDAAAAVEIRRIVADPAIIKDAFADIDVVCGMRFHSLVLAAMLQRPFVGITHDIKISEICRHFDMPCFDATNFKGADFAASVEQIRDRIPDRQQLEESIRSAQKNFRAFEALST